MESLVEDLRQAKKPRRNANVGRFSSRAAGVMVNDFESLEVRLARIPGSESLEKNEGGTSSVCSALWTAVMARPGVIQHLDQTLR